MFDVIKRSVINRLSLRTRVGTLSIPGALLEGSSAKGSILEFVDFPTDAKKVVKIIRNGLVIFALYFWGDRSLEKQRRIAFQIQFVCRGLF